MSIKRGFNAESIKMAAIKNVMSMFSLTAHADEVNTTASTTEGSTATNPTPQINYEQLISAARKEEKEKLYPRIQKLEDDNKKLVEQGNANLIKIGDLTAKLNELTAENKSLKEGSEDSQIVKDLKKQLETLEAENKKLKEETPDRESIEAEIRAEYELKSYISEQKSAHKDEILSTFLDSVTGATKEDVDKAVQELIDKTTSIKKDLGLIDAEGNPVEKSTSKKAETKKKSAPKANPSVTTGETSAKFDAEYIQNLDPRSDEYKEFRKSLGLR